MKQTRNGLRFALFFALLAGAVLLLLVFNMVTGSVKIPIVEFAAIFAGKKMDSTTDAILWQIRLPRALAAAVLGGALALAGYLLQTFFHNPIAGPFVLGISSGAKLTVALAMIVFAGNASNISSATMIAAAFVGALVSMGFVLIMARVVDKMSMLIVGGVMIGYICSAVTDIVVTFADDADIVNLHNWSKGSFSGITWDNVTVLSVTVFVTTAVIFLLSKPIGAYQMGEVYAQSVGVNLRLLRILLVFLSSVLAAEVVSVGALEPIGEECLKRAKALAASCKQVICCRDSFAPWEPENKALYEILRHRAVLW